jgi:hypothetical protein
LFQTLLHFFLQVIRPGQFMPGPIRETGLKRPLLIKGDRYNFNPHMGVALTGTGPSATDLADRMDQEKEVRMIHSGQHTYTYTMGSQAVASAAHTCADMVQQRLLRCLHAVYK